MKKRLIIPQKMQRFQIFLILAILAILQLHTNYVYGQQSGYSELRKNLDFMFERIDKKSVPTGLLRDYAVEEEDFDLYTGRETLTDKNKVTIVRYASLLSSIQSAALTSDPIKGFEQTLKQWSKTRNTEAIRLSVMSFKYAEIKADALTSGLIKYTNGQVQNVASANTPYQIRQVFAASCLDYAATSQEVTFILPQEYILTNTNCTNYQLNFGNGFIPLVPNEPIKARLKEGENNIIIKAKSENGEELTSHTFITVESIEGFTTRALRSIADLTYSITGKSYNGVQTSAKVSVKYGWGHNSVKKPFIFVEGFDPVMLNTKNNGAWSIDTLYHYYSTYIDRLLQDGYDLVYVNWDKSEEYIQANANLLIDIISDINSKKANASSSEPNVIMAHSMGGLISRYALKKMENENKKHQVNTFISYDTPHLGAHIPLGLLYGFHGIKKFINDHNLLKNITESLGDVPIKDYIKYGESMAYSTAAQQMLVYYVDPAGNFNNSQHVAWQRELNTLGFPKGDSGTSFNMWAISNGNYSSTHIPSEAYISTKFHGESDILFLLPFHTSAILGLTLNDVVVALLNVLPGRSSIDGHFDLYPAKAVNQKVTSISMQYKKKFLWLIPITKNLFSYERYFQGSYLFDIYPSSPYNLNMGVISMEGGLPVVGNFSADVYTYPRIPFIPTSSALAYGDGLSSSSSFTSAPPVGATPFGENYLLQQATNHANLTGRAFEWIYSRLGTSIVGPNVGTNGAQYSLSKAAGNITWSTSNSNVATINQQGVLTVKGKGIISVVANYRNIKYSKLILVGLPRFVLSASHEPGGYKLKATCIDPEYSNRLSELSDAITYKWGVKFTNKDIQWVESKSYDILLQLEEGSQEATVFLEIADKNGNTSTTQSVKVTSRDIYAASDRKLYITSDGSLYNEKLHLYYYDMSRIYVNYVPGLPDTYKQPKWMIISAKVISPFAAVRNIPFSESGPAIMDVIPQREFDYIKNGSENNQNYTYMLILYNGEGLAVQYFPIVFTYKDRI